MNDTQQQHTISVYVANKPGVLMRVSQVFARRGYNIESLVVSPALDGKFSRMTLGAAGDPETLSQIIKQLGKLVDVVHATEHVSANVLQKELALIKVGITQDARTEVLQLVTHFKAQTVDLTEDSLVIQVTGNSDKLDAMIELLKKHGIIEIVRTGKVVMARGQEAT